MFGLLPHLYDAGRCFLEGLEIHQDAETLTASGDGD